MDCKFSQDVHAWHDGELPVQRRQELAEHLANCESCRQELRELVALSRMLSGAGRRTMPPAVVARLHKSLERIGERSVLRIAEALSAAAAILLAIGLAALTSARPAATRTDSAQLASVELPEDAIVSSPEPTSVDPVQDLQQWIESSPGQLSQSVSHD